MGRAESATSATGDRVRDMSESARGTAGSMAATARQVPDTVISQTQGNPMAVGLVASAPACRPPRSSRRASRSSDLPRPRVGSAADIRPARGRGRSGARSVPRPDDAAASNAEREGIVDQQNAALSAIDQDEDRDEDPMGSEAPTG